MIKPNLDRPILSRGYACIGLHQPKDHKNIGCVLRACGCFNADMVAVAGKRYSQSNLDTQKAWKHIPMLLVDDLKAVIPKGCVPIAIDLVENSRSLIDYIHPERAFYIFGGEDRTLDESVLNYCRDKIYIPTTHCMNLAATVNVVLYDRMIKRK